MCVDINITRSALNRDPDRVGFYHLCTPVDASVSGRFSNPNRMASNILSGNIFRVCQHCSTTSYTQPVSQPLGWVYETKCSSVGIYSLHVRSISFLFFKHFCNNNNNNNNNNNTNDNNYIYIYIYVTVNLYNQVICILPDFFS